MVIFFLWIIEVPRRRPPPHTDVENEDISFRKVSAGQARSEAGRINVKRFA
jgi:hypothetical protein